VVVTARTRLPARAPAPIPRVRARPPSGNFFPTHRTARARPTVIARVAIASSRATPRVLVTVLARRSARVRAVGATRETKRSSEGDASMRIFVVSIAVVSSRSRGRVPRASLAQDSDVDATRRFFATASMDRGRARGRGGGGLIDRSWLLDVCMGRRVEDGEDGRRDASCGAVRDVMRDVMW